MRKPVSFKCFCVTSYRFEMKLQIRAQCLKCISLAVRYALDKLRRSWQLERVDG